MVTVDEKMSLINENDDRYFRLNCDDFDHSVKEGDANEGEIREEKRSRKKRLRKKRSVKWRQRSVRTWTMRGASKTGGW
jgi:hypothetical protein